MKAKALLSQNGLKWTEGVLEKYSSNDCLCVFIIIYLPMQCWVINVKQIWVETL